MKGHLLFWGTGIKNEYFKTIRIIENCNEKGPYGYVYYSYG